MKRKEWAWETLKVLSDSYHARYRILRNRYKWSPDVVDNMDLGRIWRIFDETIEDNEKGDSDEDDFE